jgi:hypothetical protein
MTKDTHMLEQSIGDVVGEVLDAADDELYVVNPTEETVEELLDVMAERDGPTVRLLAGEDVLKETMDDFKIASSAADLSGSGDLEFQVYESTANTLLVTESSVVAVVSAVGRAAGLVTEDDAFVEGAYDQYATAWDDAEAFNLRTPAISEVRDTLRDDVGDAAADDFDDVLASLETARGDGDGLDEVTISLLVAAKNQELLYDISKWGEDVGIASKATFSRTKTDLEENGLIDTEKVPIDVGRPRLRLKLGDDRLTDATTDELASVAQSVIAK